MKYSITIDKLNNPDLIKFLKNSNCYLSTMSNGLLKKQWDCFTLIIFGYLVHFRKLRKKER